MSKYNILSNVQHLETVHTPTTGSTLPSVPESIEVAPEPAKMTEQSIFHQAIPLIQSISQNHTGFTPLSPRNPMQVGVKIT